MNDVTYDGTVEHYGRRFGVLQGGLGQLTDGDVGGDAFWLDNGNGKSFEWVGWYDLVNLKPSILFEFEHPRRFHKILFHGNNRPGNVRVFKNLLVAFSMDGSYFSRKFVFYPSNGIKMKRNQSMWIEVDLHGHIGKYLNCEFSYEGKWIVLSEIRFATEEYKGESNTNKETPTKGRENTPSVRKTERELKETNKFLSLQGIIAMAAVGAALLLLTVLFIIWLTRVHQEGEDGEYPIRNVNRIVNSLKRGTLQGKEGKKPRHYSSSSESDEDVENLMVRKMNNDVPRDQPWFKSLDKHKMNNMVMMNNTKSWDDKKLGDDVPEKALDLVQLDV
ncbi:epithelial discoidin domain-containing receptor 1-like [Dendronephthya gigantea]|uniref:epithelial discoidin domain-containing receptor 1-like n=1 Tax=Dendronephthya gigantea TaxID=151771 RepID=UPI0010693258|nr:epithelial discoidin domain-containing receptor 1-like [Dendronephthya gigantea]